MSCQRAAHSHELVDVLEQMRLLAAERGSVDDGLAERSAAAQTQPGLGRTPPAAKARRAVPVGDADRAEQPEVVEMKHGPGASRLGSGERSPPELRMDVVGVDDAHCVLAHGARDLSGVKAAGQQPGGRSRRTETVARALEHLDRLPSAREQRREIGHSALLATGRAVAVVEDQDHASGDEPGLCTRTAPPGGPGPSSFGASAAMTGGVRTRAGENEKRSTR